jgi:hypothetical protein
MQSKNEIELAVFKAFWVILLAVRVFWLRLAVLLDKFLDGFSLVHTGIYGAHKQHTIRKKKWRFYRLARIRRNLDMKIGIIFLEDFLMAWLK